MEGQAHIIADWVMYMQYGNNPNYCSGQRYGNPKPSRTDLETVLADFIVYYEGAKPYGVVTVDVAHGVLAAPPEFAEDLPHRDSFTRTPWTYTAGHGERGAIFYLALRWHTNEGVSPWSSVQSVVIP